MSSRRDNRRNTGRRGVGPNMLRDIQQDIEQQFNKRYEFPAPPSGESPVLPPLDTVFSEPVSRFDTLQRLKERLNLVKSRLNVFEINDWHEHTRNRSSLVPILMDLRHNVRAEFVTQAFAKLYECVYQYELVPPKIEAFYSVHLCEAPGAFITGLNHYLKLNHPSIRWEWFANTLNPYYEGNCLGSMIIDDRFILRTLDSWCFGEDNTGDIMQRQNLDAIVRRSKQFEMVNLVTADGSIDCHDAPEDQEDRVSQLHLAEAVTALKMLSSGGSFVLKMFTFYEHCSVSLLYLLYVCFEELHVFKPCTSKPGNSEVYVIARSFRKPKGIDSYLDRIFDNLHSSKSMFSVAHIPQYFVDNVQHCADEFMAHQQNVIERNIHFYENKCDLENLRIERLKLSMSRTFFDLYGIRRINMSQTILKGMDVNNLPNINPRFVKGTYNERSKTDAINSDQKLAKLKANLIDLIENRQDSSPWYKFSDPPDINDSCFDLIHFSCGKPIEVLQSSRFVVIPYLLFLKDVIKFINNELPHKEQKKERIFTFDEPTYSLIVDIKSYANMSCYSAYELDIFRTLLQRITDLPHQEGIDYLTVENWLLISQFSVGLVLFLKMYVFEKVDLIACNQLRFSCLKTDGISSLQYLNESLQSELIRCAPDKTILGIVPIEVLLEGGFVYAVMNYNSRLCLEYCLELLVH
ncbi:cap-specific mRNA (nucleoside-2'-O-)-methyltransferase 2 [Toxorhynchites rutilus septentrionalis]|uniref:cap-specific mRNA (nucleoside-2'-O-)-methyltransferase 2 n=1 Tax=Toxorhynchites rutilus septentrionalis TaxID=329112 RepID=UPI00247AD145|nr:cap-specific mRNA (nucleoside-2'-O-)-methyltransferase 2 [Toxorhynchites rutilus septentrionalis]